MLSFFDFAREMTIAGVAVRMVTALICGGIIGIEREFKRRPAGFRTHILICLGAATTILTSLYLYQVMHYFTDISRLAAQVIAGIGFIGAGTIIITKRQRVKGLTTAAGLWTSAIIGIVCGAGYIECALFATAMVLLAELLLIRIEYRFAHKKLDAHLYIEYGHSATIEQVIRSMKEHHFSMNGLEITRISDSDEQHHYCAVVTVQTSSRGVSEDVIKNILAFDDIITVEEL